MSYFRSLSDAPTSPLPLSDDDSEDEFSLIIYGVETLRDPAEIERSGADGTTALGSDDGIGTARDVSIDASDGAEASTGPRDGEWKRVGAALATVKLEEVKPPGTARDVSIDASDGAKASTGPRDGEWKRVGAPLATVKLEEVKPPLCKLVGANLDEQRDFCEAVVSGDQEKADAVYDRIVQRDGAPEKNPLGLRDDSVIELSGGSILARMGPITNPEAEDLILSDRELAAIVNAFCVYRGWTELKLGKSLVSTKLVAALIRDDTDAVAGDAAPGTFVTSFPLPVGYNTTERGRKTANLIAHGLLYFCKRFGADSRSVYFLYADRIREINLQTILSPNDIEAHIDYVNECIRKLAASGLDIAFNGLKFTVRTPCFLLFVLGHHSCNSITVKLAQQMLCRIDEKEDLSSNGSPTSVVGDDALVDKDIGELRKDIQQARSILTAEDVLPMTQVLAGVSTRQRVQGIINGRIASLVAQPLESPSALMVLQAAGLTHELEKLLQPIVLAMDKHGSHGMSVSQLLRQVVDSRFRWLNPKEPLAGDDVLCGSKGEWYGTTVLRINAKTLLKKKKKDRSLIDQLPSTLVALGEDDPGPPPEDSMRLYRASTVDDASRMLALGRVQLSAKEAITDFGPAVCTTPDLQYALDYAATYICLATQQDAVVLVFDVPKAKIAVLEQLNLTERGPWAAVVTACRRASMVQLETDQSALHALFNSADLISGAITANATGIECGQTPRPEKWQQFAFRTDRGVAALLQAPCRLLIRFAYPSSWC